MIKIQIYGDCHNCHKLHDMLNPEDDSNKIEHEHITDQDIINKKALEFGVMYAPIVVIDGERLDLMPHHPIMYFRYIQGLLK